MRQSTLEDGHPAVDLLFGPVLAFFSAGFYRRTGQRALWRALLYLGYMSFLFSLGIAALFVWRWMPAVDAFVVWAADRLPTVVFTREGPIADVTQPFELHHPVYGRVLVVDTAADMADPDRPAWLYLTGTHLVLGGIGGPRTSEYRCLDIVPTSPEQAWQDVIVSSTVVQRLYEDLLPFAPLAIVLAFPVFFAWKLVAAVAYSLLAVGLSLVLRGRLGYRQLLTLTVFAMTPVVVMEFLAMGGLANLVASSVRVSCAVTAAYLMAAILCAKRAAPGPAAMRALARRPRLSRP